MSARVGGLRARLVWERAARGAFAACAVERRARTWVSGWDQGFGCWEFVDMAWVIKSGGVSARVGGLRARLVWEGAARGALAACAAERRALCAAGQRGGGVGAHARRINTACPRWTCGSHGGHTYTVVRSHYTGWAGWVLERMMRGSPLKEQTGVTLDTRILSFATEARRACAPCANCCCLW